MEERKRPHFDKRQVIYYSLIGVLAVIFIVCAVYLGSYLYDNYRQNQKYDDLAGIVDNNRPAVSPDAPTGPSIDPNTTEPDAPQETMPPILPEYQPICDLNPDTVGWIRIPGTRVNYPVLMSNNGLDFYLDKDFYGEPSRSGAIYVRPTSDVFKPSDNITIYGHHMKTGHMFGHLQRYDEKSYWETHQQIFFDTIYEHHEYKIFAVFKTSGNQGEGFPYHMFIDSPSEAAYNEFVSTLKKMAFYDTGITPVYGDKLICLSTCEYTLDNGRFVVAAVRVS